MLNIKYNQRTIGPVSLTWVLKICWIRTNLEIQEHTVLYKLSPIQKHQKQIWSCHKNGHGQGQPRVIIWKKALGHGYSTNLNKFWQHFKAFIIPIILYQFQKHPFCLIIVYDILFYFIHVYKAPGQEETTLGDNFWCKQKGLIILITACIFQNSSDFMHIFSWFYTCA